jgi:FkbM family methyltransferase
LPSSLCIDVGASYYPHGRWHLFLDSPETRWLAVEPNVQNLGYVKTWSFPSRIHVCSTGLSEQGGPQTLFITHVDSGSSLLEPRISPSMARRVNPDYLFPFERRTIETLTLPQAAASVDNSLPVLVKLDTQGTELSILKGAHEWIAGHRIVGIEMESTLQAEPVMSGAGKFWEACAYFESQGYELLDVKPIFGASRVGSRPRGKTFLNECDAVFALRQDVAAGLSPEHRILLLAFYLCYHFYEEALLMLEDDAGMRAALEARGCDVASLRDAIRATI